MGAQETDASRYRLPHVVVPSRYELTLEPDLDAATFAGFESVTLDVVEATDELILNAIELDIDEAWVERSSGERVTATVSYEPDTERVRLALADELEPGTYTLHARFRGILNDKLRGFYRSTFKDDDGVEHAIATTQFESTHARRAFPCWDEPAFKAVFAVTLVVPDDLAALSNGGEISSEADGDGRRTVRFADTMTMSTYLVAFIVGPLDVTKPVDVDGVPLRIAYPRGKGHLTAYALDVGAHALRFFTDYYAIPYPGDKLDLVAIPDFAFGAMENLGCVTFREVLLLADPETASHPELQRVAEVINHEIAHMWFGDLVTMKWWNGIWLNEAFATFMEMQCTDHYRPEWQTWTDFGVSRTAAFDTDSLASTRPIEFEVVSPHDAEGMFDVLTYEKGAAVLRMIEQYLGEEAMRGGIRHYLATHQYGNTETTDLWDAIEETTGQPVRRIADTWIFQGGYPIVSVELDSDGASLGLAQQRFQFAGGEDGGGSGRDTADDGRPLGEEWAVPMVLAYGTNGATRIDKLLLDAPQHEVALPFSAEWVLANAGGSGFYRAHYSPKLLTALAARGAQLSSLERYGLVDDTFASVLAGATTAADFVTFARGFGDETDLAVWQRLGAGLRALEHILDDEALDDYHRTVRALVAPALVRMGAEPAPDEDSRTGQVRATLFELTGVLGADNEVVERARELFSRYRADASSVDPALASAALTVVAETGGAAEFEAMLERYRHPRTPQEETRFLHALARFHDDAEFAQMLELAVTEVRTQNAPYLLGLALQNRTEGQQAWEFVRANWDRINDRFPNNTIVRMLAGVTVLSKPEVAADVQAFFRTHDVPQGHKTLMQHLERLRVNVALRERESSRLADSLKTVKPA